MDTENLNRAFLLAQEQVSEINIAYDKIVRGLNPEPHFERIDEICRLVSQLLRD
jgi:hypothetical protein